MVRHRERSTTTVGILSDHRNMLALPDNLEAERLQRTKNLSLRRVDREFHPPVSDASVMEASITSS
jgi:hypothetical protein